MWSILKNVLGLDKPKLVPPHSTTYDGGVAVELQSVSKSFIDKAGDMVLAVDEMKLKIYDNEFFTLLGPSGCGKTTLLRLIAGFDIPNSGRIVLYGDSVENVPAYRRHLNTVFQSYSLFPHLTIAQNIGFGLKMLGKDKSFIAKRVNSMLKMVKLSHLANRYPADLSGGQQQRIALARALACEPDVLLLDEPLSALDYKLRKQMQLELKRIQKETKITFIFVTHDQEEAMALSDRIAVLSDGKIQQVGKPKDVYEHPQNFFVADFIGEVNILGDSWNGMTANDNAVLGIRPEKLGISPISEITGVPQGTILEKGKVIVADYQGFDSLYQVQLDIGTIMDVRQQHRQDNKPISVGDSVIVSVPLDGIRQIKKS